MKLNLRKLSFGDIVLDEDMNLPKRAEELGHLDIDKQMAGLMERAGIKEGDLVVDVGAFVGDTAQAMGRYGASVVAFEPFFDAYVCAVFNCRNLDVSVVNLPTGNGEYVRLYDKAVCNGNEPNMGMRSVRDCPEGFPGAIKTAKLDDCSLVGVKFMKIDCEGSEIPTLLGASETIRRYKPKLFVEMYRDGLGWRGTTPDQLYETIKGFGYSLEKVGDDPRWDWWCEFVG